MKKIELGQEYAGQYSDTEHLVFEVDTQGVSIHFGRIVDDLIISSPDGDVLLNWKVGFGEEFDTGMLLKAHDNMKELGGIKCTVFSLRAFEGANTVYITIQRN